MKIDKPFSEYTQAEINALTDEEFKDVSPFEKKSCAHCAHLVSHLSWWCGNKEAIQHRGTNLPGTIRCQFWAPDYSQIDEKHFVNLGKKTFWWKVEVILLSPFWFLSVSLTKKSWAEFKHGLISHQCEFDRSKPEIIEGHKFYPCKHFGCTVVDPDDNFFLNSFEVSLETTFIQRKQRYLDEITYWMKVKSDGGPEAICNEAIAKAQGHVMALDWAIDAVNASKKLHA